VDPLFGPLLVVLRLQATLLGGAVRSRREQRDDRGVSTLEMVIIALGLMAIAALLVTALTVAVTNRTNKIK
jgi:Flp pilus assembly protein TadG